MGVFNLNMANKNIARFFIFNDTGIYNLALLGGFVSGTATKLLSTFSLFLCLVLM